MNIREFSHNLEKLYAEMSSAFSTYQSSTGWNCHTGCGKCCLNPEIEASPLEMIPWALKCYDEGTLEEWLTKLESSTQEYCLLYEGSSEGKGKCGHYQYRPALCRMFGVAGYKNKKQEITLSICKILREEYKIEKLPEHVNPESIPTFLFWSYHLSILDQKLLNERMPINHALKNALEKVAIYAQYQQIDPVV